nr:restriction endonuclease subunit S [uncultured Desulfobulbus sp.]
MEERYQAYPEYKDSGVEWLGSIPQHWKVNRIKFAATLNPSKSELADLPNNTEVTFLPMEAIGEHGELDLTRTKNLFEVFNGYTYLREGDICIAKITPCFENGKGAILRGLSNNVAFATTEVIPVRCKSPEDAPYFYYLLTSNPFRSIAEGAMYGAGGQKRVSDSFVANYHFSFPPPEEQTQIANFLDHETAKIDNLIEKQQQLIGLLKEKRQAVISHAVTKGLNPDAPMKDSGVEWLGEVPEHWVVCQFKFNTLVMQTGPFGSQLHADDYVQDGVPLINPAHIVAGQIVPDPKCSVDGKTQRRLERHQLTPGDLILARRGELGRCAVIRDNQEGWLCGTGSLKATFLQKLAPDYGFILISSNGVKVELSLESKGSTMNNLNTETLGRVRVPVPPIKEQKAILKYIQEINQKYDTMEELALRQVILLQERRTALISAAVTGKIDVRNWQPTISQQPITE